MPRLPRHILVVDDDELVRQVVVAVLRGAGYDVHEADSGHRAVDHFRDHTVDLVLLDIQMPEMDGWATLARLREMTVETPVVVMSGHATEDDVRGTGAVELLAKPFDYARLIDVVTQHARPVDGSMDATA